ncbi:kelch-like protein 36 isoform X2 [Clavelina lepadiformis]
MYEKVFEIFNVSQAPRKTYLNMVVGSSCCGAVFLQGLLYTVGGTTGEEINTTTNRVSCLNLKEDDLEWKDVAPMNKKRFGHGTAILNDKIYVTGGVDENGLYLRCGECYNPTSNAWTKISAMKLARSTHALAACKGHVYAIGGRLKDDNGSRLVSVERYDPGSDSWDEIAPMKTFRSWLAAVPMDDNYIYALGGESRDDKIEKSVERYDVITGEWNNVSAMQESRHCHAASVVQGKIYTVGGACQSGVILCSLECYDPTTDEWSMIDDELDENFINHALVAV